MSLPPHALMERAGSAVAGLGRALYPHARRIWIACGPGNNGGDGLLAAARWRQALGDAVTLHVTWDADPERLPHDARHALRCALDSGIVLESAPPSEPPDLVIDALLGLGTRPIDPGHRLGQRLVQLQQLPCPLLAVDLPSGLHPDSGALLFEDLCATDRRRHTLSLLTLKPGLFTGSGRDLCGDLWHDDLDHPSSVHPSAWLLGPARQVPSRRDRHRPHKGQHGDVLVIGGTPGMEGAALLAGRAALLGGAGRVWICHLGPERERLSTDALFPELMHWPLERLTPAEALLEQRSVVCGCGAGQAIAPYLTDVLRHSRDLVLDADALNTLAKRPDLEAELRSRHARGQCSVITPHPLEAARLLHVSTSDIQADRTAAAQELAQRFQCTVVLKGSGTVIACPMQSTVWINSSGNSLLGSAGTGDVLAGMIGAGLAHSALRVAAAPHERALQVACQAVFEHGWTADQWPASQALSAGRLVERLPRR